MANSDVVEKQVTWNEPSAEAPHVEKTEKEFVVDTPALPQNFNWFFYRIYNLGVNKVIDWLSNYGAAQIFSPADMTIPESKGPTDRVYVNGEEEEALVLPDGAESEVHISAQIVRNGPDIVLVWSAPVAGNGTEALSILVEREIIGAGDKPGTSSAQVTATPTVPTAAHEEKQTTIDLGDLSQSGQVDVKGKTLSFLVRRNDDGNDTFNQPAHLKRVEVR